MKRINSTKFLLGITILLLVLSTFEMKSDILRPKGYQQPNFPKESKIQDGREVKSYFDVQKNTVSNLDFYTSNYGIFGLDVARNRGGGFWPRGSKNQYIFGGGIWFAGQKRDFVKAIVKGSNGQDSTVDSVRYRSLVEVTYNPSKGNSWMTPGRAEDAELNQTELSRYRTSFSTDFNPIDGTPLSSSYGPPNWPVWDSSPYAFDTLKKNRYFGRYIHNADDRNLSTYKRGPSYISGEDIFTTYHDLNLKRYDDGEVYRKTLGYPMGLQFEQTIYSWGFGQYKDFVFIRYDVINISKDTLFNCSLAPIMDVDIATYSNSGLGAGNDRVRYYYVDSTLNMAYQWSDGDRGEQGNGFGYLGFDFLESPTVIKAVKIKAITPRDTFDINGIKIKTVYDTTYEFDPKDPSNGYIRKDRPYYPNSQQLGLTTFRNWSSQDDKNTDQERWNFLNSFLKDNDTGPGDKRYMMVSGTYHFRPGDTSRTIVGVLIAPPSKGSDPDNTIEDLGNLVNLDKFAQTVYDNNFLAPVPPDKSNFEFISRGGNEPSGKYIPINNGVVIKWDSTSEMSVDLQEDELDFFGYTLYRARRTDRDTVSGTDNPSNKSGPYGWKQIANYQLTEPFVKSNISRNPYDPNDSYKIDSLRIAGQYYNLVDDGKSTPKWVVDSMVINIVRQGSGVIFASDSLLKAGDSVSIGGSPTIVIPKNNWYPVVLGVDTIGNRQTGDANYPWDKFYYEKYIKSRNKFGFINLADYDKAPNLRPNSGDTLDFINGIHLGYVKINRALVPFNPLYFNRISTTIDLPTYLTLPSDGLIRKKEDRDSITKSCCLWHLDATGNKVFNDSIVPSKVNIVKIIGKDTIWADSIFNNNKVISYDHFQVTTKVDSAYNMTSLYKIVVKSPWSDFADSILKSKVNFHRDTILGPPKVIKKVWEDSLDANKNPIKITYIKTELHDSTTYSIDLWVPMDYKIAFKDSAHIKEVMDSIYSWLQQGKATVFFPDFENALETRKRVIVPYMSTITKNRTFLDIGDDNRNGVIENNSDPTKTEKLLNNTEYYYKILAYDYGDLNKRTSHKLNGSAPGLPNFVTTVPKAPNAGSPISFKLIYADSNLLGGLSNFRIYPIDPDRASQIFVGDTLEFNFTSNMFGSKPILPINNQLNYGVYNTGITLVDITNRYPLFNWNSPLPLRLCGDVGNNPGSNWTVENSKLLVGFDTVLKDPVNGTILNDIVDRNSKQVLNHSTTFTTGDFTDATYCVNNFIFPPAKSTIGFSFEYNMKQFGGAFRPDSSTGKASGINAVTNVTFIDDLSPGLNTDNIQTTDIFITKDNNFVSKTFNNGPGKYEMEFLPGGQETIVFRYNKDLSLDTFTLDYLNIKITNKIDIKDTNSIGEPVNYKYPRELQNLNIDPGTYYTISDFRNNKGDITKPTKVYYPDIRCLTWSGDDFDYSNKFNIHNYAFINSRTKISAFKAEVIYARNANDPLLKNAEYKYSYTGLQGKYYKSAYSKSGNVIDFSHIINISGVNFVLDYANRGKIRNLKLWDSLQKFTETTDTITNEVTYTENATGTKYHLPADADKMQKIYWGDDFKVGDKVNLNTTGGVYGLPMNNAKVRFVVQGGTPQNNNYTNDMVDEVKIVPNPYYITHEGQKSPFDAKLYITKLPKICDIQIFTTMGDLVKTIHHDESANSNPNSEALEVWDLLSSSGLRVQSQTLIAKIKTPNGAESIQQFTVVVGPFRVIDDN